MEEVGSIIAGGHYTNIPVKEALPGSYVLATERTCLSRTGREGNQRHISLHLPAF